MKSTPLKYLISAGLAVLAAGFPIIPQALWAQAPWPYAPAPPMAVPTTPDAQRNALNEVRARVSWLQNAIRTAPNYGAGGADQVWQQFQFLRGSYSAFTSTLNPQQAASGANDFAELSAGLDILQESFSNYQQDVAGGRAVASALRDMCQVLGQAAGIWLQEFNKDCSRLRVGF